MKIVQISLNSIGKVKSFVNAITQFDFDFDLISGRYVIDAKSIMGIFSLDLSKPIDLAIHTETNLDEIMEVLKPYIIEYVDKSPDIRGIFIFQKAFYSSGSQLITSTVSMAVFISSSILSVSFSSDFLITLRFGFVTGCFATNMVQQSSNGKMEVS